LIGEKKNGGTREEERCRRSGTSDPREEERGLSHLLWIGRPIRVLRAAAPGRRRGAAAVYRCPREEERAI
jgi:hypothetical protein